MGTVTSNADFYRTDVTKATAEELSSWWRRDWNGIFFPFKARLVRQVQGDKQDVLCFTLARAPQYGEFQVDLKYQLDLVWPDLPSTVQLATPDKPYGFIFLTEAWATRENAQLRHLGRDPNANLLSLAETGGGKWPLSATAEMIRDLISGRVANKHLQAQLLELVREAFK